MDKVLAAVHLDSPDSMKRFLVLVGGAICLVLINPILASKGLPTVSDGAIESAAAAIVAYIAQSGYKSAQAAGSAAAAKVETPADAAKVL